MARLREILLPWDSQPHGLVEINAGSPFAVGLVDGVSLGGGALRRIVPRAQPTFAGVSLLPAVTPVGAAQLLKGTGSSSYIQIPQLNVAGVNRLQITGLLRITSQDSEMIYELSPTADSNAGFYFYGLTSSSFRIQVNTGGSPAFFDLTYTAPSQAAVYTLRIDTTASPAVFELWVNGVLAGSGGISVAAGTFVSTALNIGSRNAGSLSSDGSFGDHFVHNRWMQNSELLEFHRNLWRIFEDQRIPVPMAGAGGALNIDLDSGSYAYTGQDATLAVTRAIDLDAGSYLYTGQTVTISYGRALSLDAGSYTYTGQTADFTIARKIDLDTGSYAYTGQDATLSYTPSGSTYNIDLDAGAYTYTGQAVDFTIARNLALDAGVYTYTGQDAGLAYSGASSVTIKAGSWLRYRVI